MTTISSSAENSTVHYKTVRINDLDIFYREAGAQDAPVILLLHGFPNFVQHVSQSDPAPCQFVPRDRARLSRLWPEQHAGSQELRVHVRESTPNIVDQLVGASSAVNKYSMYVMDYGAPVGYRLALLHPERVQGLIVQNGNAYEEGLLEFWDPIKKYWNDRLPENRSRDSLPGRREVDALAVRERRGGHDAARPDNLALDQIRPRSPGKPATSRWT